MARVELIYDEGCPNVDAARAQLRRAFERAGRDPRWRELSSADPGLPDHARGYGSPTILVDGHDVASEPRSAGSCCRVYARADGRLAGVPSVDRIVEALRSAEAEAAPAPLDGSTTRGPRSEAPRDHRLKAPGFSSALSTEVDGRAL